MRTQLASLAAALMLTVATQASALADQVRFQLKDVRVDQQRETEGDRPYFTSLAFRVKLCSPRTQPVVNVLEREPHDWVSKSEYAGSRLGGATHMIRGQSLRVPSWMGEHTFNNVSVLPFLNPEGNYVDLTQVEVLGVAYFSFDNNNTPPHVVRGLMNDARRILQTVLRQELQETRVVEGVPRGCPTLLAGFRSRSAQGLSDNLNTALQAVALQTINGWRVAELLFQLTVGSTFQSDQPTGINIVLVPMLSGLPEEFATSAGEPYRYPLPAGDVLAQTTLLTPTNADARLTFTGSGAVYSSAFGLNVTATSPSQIASTIRFRIRTGRDDLRGGDDNVFASVRIGGRWRPEVMLNRGGERWANDTIHDAIIQIPRVPVTDIEAIRLRTSFRGGHDGDNWNMESLQIDWRGAGGIGGELGRHGYKRFTGNDRELLIEFR